MSYNHERMTTRAPRSIGMIVLAKAMRLLMFQARVTARDVVDSTGAHIVTASRILRAMHDEEVIHISGWVEDPIGRDQTPIFTLGPGTDVPRKKLSNAERSRNYRDRQRTAALKVKYENNS